MPEQTKSAAMPEQIKRFYMALDTLPEAERKEFFALLEVARHGRGRGTRRRAYIALGQWYTRIVELPAPAGTQPGEVAKLRT